ncbi:MAG: exo-alpha-sialidase, partial [Saprospiraceae bacterium]|nr:exo-alpha-sialidase [Saprospiraceae bacterium]
MNRNHLIFLFLFFVSSYQITAQIVDSGFVFKEAPFPSCHASTICSTADGYMVAWFGGTHEKHKDVGIWIARSTDGQWTAPVEVANGIQHADKRYPCWNPVLFRNAETGDISLYYKVGPSPREWWGMLMVSSDEGLTWSLPRRLPEDILGPIKNKPELLANGMLLHPSSTESDTDGWKVHMEISDMDGNNWKRIGPLPEEDIDAIQPSILIHP